MPRQGHLETVLHTMGYLKLRHNFRLAFDPPYPKIDHSNFQECDWTDFYEGVVEVILPNTPLLEGSEVYLQNHADNKQTK